MVRACRTEADPRASSHVRRPKGGYKANRQHEGRASRRLVVRDRQVINVAVTDFRERTMEIRILISASDAGRAFDLRCEMREKIIAVIER